MIQENLFSLYVVFASNGKMPNIITFVFTLCDVSPLYPLFVSGVGGGNGVVLYNPRWSQIHDPPATAPQEQGLQECIARLYHHNLQKLGALSSISVLYLKAELNSEITHEKCGTK